MLPLFDSYSKIKSIIKNLPIFTNGEGYLYVFNIGPDKFKIGRAKNAYSRLETHQNALKCYGCFAIDLIILIGPFIDVIDAEAEFVQILKREGFKSYSGDEWFHGNINDIHLYLDKIKSAKLANTYQSTTSAEIVLDKLDCFELKLYQELNDFQLKMNRLWYKITV